MSEPATRLQPSTSTKNISLNGNETTTGGSIIMPIDIKTDATTRSMIRNGRNSRKADLEGALELGDHEGRHQHAQRQILRSSGAASCAMSTNSLRSFSRTFFCNEGTQRDGCRARRLARR